MKNYVVIKLAVGLICLGASIAPSSGQVIVNPNTISGTVRLTNSNISFLNLLNAPGNEGFTNLYITAGSVPPAPAIGANTANIPATNRTTMGYELTVDSAIPGIAYAVTDRKSVV